MLPGRTGSMKALLMHQANKLCQLGGQHSLIYKTLRRAFTFHHNTIHKQNFQQASKEIGQALKQALFIVGTHTHTGHHTLKTPMPRPIEHRLHESVRGCSLAKLDSSCTSGLDFHWSRHGGQAEPCDTNFWEAMNRTEDADTHTHTNKKMPLSHHSIVLAKFCT